jgi:hypothetical protein
VGSALRPGAYSWLKRTGWRRSYSPFCHSNLSFEKVVFPVNLRDIAETACLAAWYGSSLLQTDRLEPGCVETYWRYCRFRERLWHRCLTDDASGDSSARDATAGLFEEVLVSELLTRVVAAVIWSQTGGSPSCDESARSIADRTVAGHAAVKERLLCWHRERTTSVVEALRNRRLERRLGRWCDLLVSPFLKTNDVDRFAWDPGRCREFAGEGAFSSCRDAEGPSFTLYANGLRLAVPNLTVTDRNRDAAHRAVACSILPLLPASVFGEDGLVKPRWQRLIEAGSLLDSRTACINSMHLIRR